MKYEPESEIAMTILNGVKQEILYDSKIPMDHPERTKTMKMINWLWHNGGVIDGAKIRYLDETRKAVYTTKNIPEKKIFLFVPELNMMTMREAAQSPYGQILG